MARSGKMKYHESIVSAVFDNFICVWTAVQGLVMIINDESSKRKQSLLIVIVLLSTKSKHQCKAEYYLITISTALIYLNQTVQKLMDLLHQKLLKSLNPKQTLCRNNHSYPPIQ